VIVDVACSEGLYARHLARSGATAIAVDHALPFLRAVRRRAAADGVRVIAVQAPAQRLPLAAGAVDAVVIGGSLNEVGDRAAAVDELARVTRSDGTAFSMSLTTATAPLGKLLQALLRPSGIAFPSAADTEALFAGRGFSVVSRAHDRVVLRLAMVRERAGSRRLP
jgi:ubiquinone/menaquinone biosynthesis C-methylase UbiE